MARQLDDFSISARPHSRYPWDDWCNGSVWRITRGEDFSATVESIKGTLYGRAKGHGKRVKIVSDGDVVEFQFS